MFLKVAAGAAREGEKVVMKYFGRDKEVMYKGEVDLVTKADIEAEQAIVKFIRNHFPDHGFTLEEGDGKKDSEYSWIIDPIDGTTSFVHNYPMFSISVALYKNMKPVAGVVRVPVLNETFTAEVDKGAFLNGKKITVSNTRDLKQGLIATGFPYSRIYSDNTNIEYLSKAVKRVGGIRRSGSAALDISYVACGRLDGYWEYELKIMDTAAAVIILREAGGKVTDFFGREIKDDFSRICASNGLIHYDLIKMLEE